MRVTLAALVSLAVASVEAAPRPCHRFEPATSAIVGTLTRKTLPGPPNYQSIAAGDAPETYWFVTPAKPLCVRGTPGDRLNAADVTGVSSVQLILRRDEYTARAGLIGRRVRVTGTLSTAITGHHHTPVVLDVVTLEAAR
jgi:hypothetical protein